MIEFGLRARPRGKTKQLQDIAHEFMELHGDEGFDLGEVIGWAIRSGRYQVQPPTAEEFGKQELARALRQEYYTDPQGREVRRMHPVRITDGPQQMVIWHDITKGPTSAYANILSAASAGHSSGLHPPSNRRSLVQREQHIRGSACV